jgi:antitoxin MazE
MKAVIQKWGNSNGIRLPKAALNTAKLREKDSVEIIAQENEIIIKKTNEPHRTLKERLDGYLGTYNVGEYDSSSVGKERFWEDE